MRKETSPEPMISWPTATSAWREATCLMQAAGIRIVSERAEKRRIVFEIWPADITRVIDTVLSSAKKLPGTEGWLLSKRFAGQGSSGQWIYRLRVLKLRRDVAGIHALPPPSLAGDCTMIVRLSIPVEDVVALRDAFASETTASSSSKVEHANEERTALSVSASKTATTTDESMRSEK